jgi:hypothetical protein
VVKYIKSALAFLILSFFAFVISGFLIVVSAMVYGVVKEALK